MTREEFILLSDTGSSEEWAAIEAELDSLLDCPELDEALALQFESDEFQKLEELLQMDELDSLLPTDEEIAALLDFDLQDDDFTMELDDLHIEQEEL